MQNTATPLATRPELHGELQSETLTAEEVAELVADAPTGEAFVPTDAAGVDWVLRKMNAARAEATLIRQNAELMARACERQADALEWKYGPALQTFARQELEGGKRKSVRLYHGQIGFRTKPAGVHITDEAAAVNWVQTYLPLSLIQRVDRKVLALHLPAIMADLGEVPTYIQLQPAEEVFFIK